MSASPRRKASTLVELASRTQTPSIRSSALRWRSVFRSFIAIILVVRPVIGFILCRKVQISSRLRMALSSASRNFNDRRWLNHFRVCRLPGRVESASPLSSRAAAMAPKENGRRSARFCLSVESRRVRIRLPCATARALQAHSPSHAALRSSAPRQSSPACPFPRASAPPAASRGRTRTRVATDAGPSGSSR